MRCADCSRPMRPLDGIRVLDLASFIAGPYAAAILGEFGAQVIKVEHPDGGEAGRRFGTATSIPDLSLSFQNDNRNKVSVTLDLKAPADQSRLKELARRSDVLVENFRPGTLEKWGLGPDVLLDLNPRLVILRVTGYGQDGPYRDRPGFARIAHAVGGLTALAGMPDGPPVTPGSSSLADYFSPACMARSASFWPPGSSEQTRARARSSTSPSSSRSSACLTKPPRPMPGTAPMRGREGRMTRQVCPHGHFECGDGKWVAIACTSDRMWDRLARNVLDRARIWQTDFPHTADRLANRDLIDGVVEAFTHGASR